MGFLIFCGVVVAICIYLLIAGKRGREKRSEAMQMAGLLESDLINTGKYVYGHPDINNPVVRTVAIKNQDNINICSQEQLFQAPAKIASIEISQISNITVEDATTIENKVTALRLLAVGIFAFAFKKQKKNEIFYLVISWNDGKFNHETMFEFEGTGAMQMANTSRNALIKISRNQPVL